MCLTAGGQLAVSGVLLVVCLPSATLKGTALEWLPLVLIYSRDSVVNNTIFIVLPHKNVWGFLNDLVLSCCKF